MEDFILREIDRLGEMLLIIARKLGLQEDVMPDYSLLDVKDEFDKAVCPINLDALLEQENPVWYLVETDKISFRPRRRQEGGNPTRCSCISGR